MYITDTILHTIRDRGENMDAQMSYSIVSVHESDSGKNINIYCTVTCCRCMFIYIMKCYTYKDKLLLSCRELL